jgi:hypothetical protein
MISGGDNDQSAPSTRRTARGAVDQTAYDVRHIARLWNQKRRRQSSFGGHWCGESNGKLVFARSVDGNDDIPTVRRRLDRTTIDADALQVVRRFETNAIGNARAETISNPLSHAHKRLVQVDIANTVDDRIDVEKFPREIGGRDRLIGGAAKANAAVGGIGGERRLPGARLLSFPDAQRAAQVESRRRRHDQLRRALDCIQHTRQGQGCRSLSRGHRIVPFQRERKRRSLGRRQPGAKHLRFGAFLAQHGQLVDDFSRFRN